jgi:hypothetical protein
MENPKFDGLDERDPLTGARGALAGISTNSFSVPQDNGPAKRIGGLADFVTVRGGAYFFMPSMSALRYICRIS